MKRFVLPVVAALALAGPAPAWSLAGHMVTGAIAYDVLKKDDPAALNAALKLLKAHPSYEKLWKKKLEAVPPEDRDLYLFMLAPRWADDIRKTDYDRPTWHYVTNWYTPPGKSAPSKVPAAEPENAATAFAANVTKLKTAADPSDRAVALTWVCHLVGDIHQPMHTTSLLTAEYPEGDRGGNRFWVKVTPDGKPINLHYFWDGLLTTTDTFRDAKNVAAELRLRPKFARDKLPELKQHPAFDDWKAESTVLNKSEVYRDGKLAGGTAEFTAAVLPPDYPKQAKAVAEKRAVLTGYRLAAVLSEALGAK